MSCDKWQQSIPIVRRECMAIVLWYLNIVCAEAGSMFFFHASENQFESWIKSAKISFTFWGCLVASFRRKILRDFRLLKSFSNFMKQKFHDSGGVITFLSWSDLVFGGWGFMVHPGLIPIFREALFIFNFYYIDSVSILRSGVLGFILTLKFLIYFR